MAHLTDLHETYVVTSLVGGLYHIFFLKMQLLPFPEFKGGALCLCLCAYTLYRTLVNFKTLIVLCVVTNIEQRIKDTIILSCHLKNVPLFFRYAIFSLFMMMPRGLLKLF